MIDRNSWHYKARKKYYININCVGVMEDSTIIGYWFDVFFSFPMMWLTSKIPFIKKQKFSGSLQEDKK